jgi:hypothetical protein
MFHLPTSSVSFGSHLFLFFCGRFIRPSCDSTCRVRRNSSETSSIADMRFSITCSVARGGCSPVHQSSCAAASCMFDILTGRRGCVRFLMRWGCAHVKSCPIWGPRSTCDVKRTVRVFDAPERCTKQDGMTYNLIQFCMTSFQMLNCCLPSLKLAAEDADAAASPVRTERQVRAFQRGHRRNVLPIGYDADRACSVRLH